MQHEAAKDAAEAQEDAENAASALQKQKQIEQRREAFRKRRIAAARIEQGAENTGVGTSSAKAGSLGSLSTQAAAFRGSINASDKAGDAIAEARGDARDASIDQTIGEGVSSIGMSIFQGAEGPAQIKSLFTK